MGLIQEELNIWILTCLGQERGELVEDNRTKAYANKPMILLESFISRVE